MAKIDGKVVWITGASSGIGEALALGCASLGAKVVLSSRREEELVRVSEAIGEKHPTEVMCLPLDLGKAEEFEAKLDRIVHRFGRLDVLFLNGGISQRSLLLETSMEVERRIMEIDYFGNAALAKIVLPVMIEQGFGQIGVTSSLAGKFGVPYRSGYCAAKHALHGFFETVRAEMYDKGIRVTIFCLGSIRTDISKHAVDGTGSKVGVMDKAQAKGMPAEQCAKQMVKALIQEKNEVNIGGKEVLMVFFKRWLPNFHARLIRKVSVR